MNDPFWNQTTELFTGHFAYYRNKPRKVWAKIHTSEEKYYDRHDEIVPLKTPRKGKRIYVMMHPYIEEPNLTMTIAVNPKTYADLGEQIGTVKSTNVEGIRHAEIGNAQAWYYPEDNIIVLWECYLGSQYRDTIPLLSDQRMVNLWRGFEHWLTGYFPHAKQLVTPFNDPIARSIEEYQSFLRTLGYSPIAEAAFGKSL